MNAHPNSATSRLLSLLRLSVRYFLDFWVSNFVIAGKVLSRRPSIHPGIVTMPTRVESPAEILAISNLISFTPGTLLLGIDPGRNLEIHTLDDRDPVARNIREGLEAPLLACLRPTTHPDD